MSVTHADSISHPLHNPFTEFLRRPMNWFLLFVPITLVLERLPGVPAPVVFFSAAIAIVPIAALIVQATEQLATRTGDAIGGLLNATFGNAPELIISLVALRAGYLEMVRASLVGAILANLLLALGVAFLTGGLRFHDQKFNPTAARAYSTMMFLAAISLTVPSAFSRVFAPQGVVREEKLLNIGIVRAFGKQDLQGAAQAWQQVIELAPDTPEGQAAKRALDSLHSAHPSVGDQKPGT